jgi:hypothetical protein
LSSGRLIRLDKLQNEPIFRDAHFVSVRKRDVETWKVKTFVDWLKEERSHSPQSQQA